MGMALLEKAADVLRLSIPMLRGSEAEETAVKMLALAVKALPAVSAPQATPVPQPRPPVAAAPAVA